MLVRFKIYEKSLSNFFEILKILVICDFVYFIEETVSRFKYHENCSASYCVSFCFSELFFHFTQSY